MVPSPLLAGGLLANLILNNPCCPKNLISIEPLIEFGGQEGFNLRHLVLLGAQPPDFLDRAENKVAPNGSKQRQRAQEEGDCSPSRDAAHFSHMSRDSVQHQVAYNSEEALRGLPKEGSVGVLLGLIPLTRDEKEARGDVAFEEALEGAEGHELRPVVAGADTQQADGYGLLVS